MFSFLARAYSFLPYTQIASTLPILHRPPPCSISILILKDKKGKAMEGQHDVTAFVENTHLSSPPQSLE